MTYPNPDHKLVPPEPDPQPNADADDAEEAPAETEVIATLPGRATPKPAGTP